MREGTLVHGQPRKCRLEGGVWRTQTLQPERPGLIPCLPFAPCVIWAALRLLEVRRGVFASRVCAEAVRDACRILIQSLATQNGCLIATGLSNLTLSSWSSRGGGGVGRNDTISYEEPPFGGLSLLERMRTLVLAGRARSGVRTVTKYCSASARLKQVVWKLSR